MAKQARYAYCTAYDQYIFNASFYGVIDYKTGKIYGYQADEPGVFSKAPADERGWYTDYGDYLHRKWWRSQRSKKQAAKYQLSMRD